MTVLSLLLATALACASQADPPAEPVPVVQEEEPVRHVVKVEIIPDRPVEIPSLGAEVTLTGARTTLHKDPETGRKFHKSSGELHFKVGEVVEVLEFGKGEGLVWQGHRIAVRGSRGWYELVIQPPVAADEAPADGP